jgi:outer membrane protein OmpA-like peptidoglycan-associated protein
MKKQFTPTLLLAFALALPGPSQRTYAQSSSSTSSTQSTGPMSVDLEPLQPPKSTNFWDGDDPNLVNLVTHPFANKKYVQRLTRPIKDRLNELDELTAANANAIKDVDARAQHGIQLASEKSSLADTHANDAGTKAQSAQAAATQASNRVSAAQQRVDSLDQYRASALTEIRFAPGQSLLSKNAKDALDNLAAPLKDQNSYVIEIRGYSSGHGQAAIENSQKMADSVVRYLVLSHEIPVYRIYVLGMGDAPLATDAGSAQRVNGGRVEISLLKNDLVSSAQR